MHGLVPTELNLFFRKEKKKLYPLISYSSTTISSLLSSQLTSNLKYLILAMILLESKQTNDQLCNLGRLHDKLSFYFVGHERAHKIIFIDAGINGAFRIRKSDI